MFPTGFTEQHCSTWSNGPMGGAHILPQQCPPSTGSGYNGGLFIPPGYDCDPSSFPMSCHPRWPCRPDGSPCAVEQSPMEHFGPYFPHECTDMFIPPGYNSCSPMPFHMQHWDNVPPDQYNLAPSYMPDCSPTDLEANTTEDCLSYDNTETDTDLLTDNCEPQLSQVMPTTSEEQLDPIVENMQVDNMAKGDLVPVEDPEKPSKTPVSTQESSPQHNGELIIWDTEIPQHLAEAFIGKGGQYLKFVKQCCGGLVYMSKHPRMADHAVCSMMGTKQQVHKALNLIKKRLKFQGLKNIYSPPTVTFGHM